MPENVSTGRGGAGNIGKDERTYIDAGIVREGVYGQGVADYSAGRGGAGNVVDSPNMRPTSGPRLQSEDVIPETAMRSGEGYDNFHTGRGGGGNVHKEKYGGHSTPSEARGSNKEGLGEKIEKSLKAAFGVKQDKTKPEK